MVGEPCCHGWAPMSNIPLVSDLQATMCVTEIVQPHREPAHPAVIPWGFRKGEGLTDLPLIPQATRPVMSRHHTGIAVLLAPSGQDMLELRFPLEGTPCDPLDPPLLRVFLHLSIGQPLRPAGDKTGCSALCLGTGDRVTPSKCLQDRSLILEALCGIRRCRAVP